MVVGRGPRSPRWGLPPQQFGKPALLLLLLGDDGTWLLDGDRLLDGDDGDEEERSRQYHGAALDDDSLLLLLGLLLGDGTRDELSRHHQLLLGCGDGLPLLGAADDAGLALGRLLLDLSRHHHWAAMDDRLLGCADDGLADGDGMPLGDWDDDERSRQYQGGSGLVLLLGDGDATSDDARLLLGDGLGDGMALLRLLLDDGRLLDDDDDGRLLLLDEDPPPTQHAWLTKNSGKPA